MQKMPQYDRERMRTFFREQYGLPDRNENISIYNIDVKHLLVPRSSEDGKTLPRFPDGKPLPKRDVERVKRLCEGGTPGKAHEYMQITKPAIEGLFKGQDGRPTYYMSTARLYAVYLLSLGRIDPTVGELFRTGGIDWPDEITLSLVDHRDTKFGVEVKSTDLNDGGTRHDVLVTNIDLQDAWVELHTSDGEVFGELDFGFPTYAASFRRMDGDYLEPKSAPPALLKDGDHVDPDNQLGAGSVVGFRITAKDRRKTARKVWNVNSPEMAYEVATCVTFADTDLQVAVTAPMERIQVQVTFGSAAQQRLQEADRTRTRRKLQKDFDTLARENLASHLMRKLVLQGDADTYYGDAILVEQVHHLESAPPPEPPEDSDSEI